MEVKDRQRAYVGNMSIPTNKKKAIVKTTDLQVYKMSGGWIAFSKIRGSWKKMSTNITNKEKLLQLKDQVIPGDVSAEELISSLSEKYTCKDITNRFLLTNRYQIFAENYRNRYGDMINPSHFYAYEIEEDDRGSLLNAHDPDERVYFAIESKHCFFDTNCEELFYEIALLRSVSIDDYDSETEELFELLSRIDQSRSDEKG